MKIRKVQTKPTRKKSYANIHKKLHNYAAILRKRATKSELLFKSRLDCLNIEYVFQQPIFSLYFQSIVDFYIPSCNLVIEIDGSIHQTQEKIKKDMLREKKLIRMGYRILRINNCDVSKIVDSSLIESIFC